jgi:putative glycosyltransferase (TIGR04348 family)
MPLPSVVIVSPALQGANNGNWQTASRWARWLRGPFRVRITDAWPDGGPPADVMLALHARRSAPSIHRWSEAHPGRRLAVVLTGTDLYGGIRSDAEALRSLDRAQVLVTLQERGPQALPPSVRPKARVIYQSVASRPALPKPSRHLTALAVGHLRGVKSPETLFTAARLLHDQPSIHLRHIGSAAEPGWAELAAQTQREHPSYRWLGARTPAQARLAIQRAHVLVHPSAMEGGAHVIMEAVCSGTPVLASRVDGNVGMLGEHYEGYFDHGDAQALARLLMECRASIRPDAPGGHLLDRLRAQCDARAPLFAPEAERAAVQALVTELLESR